MMNLEKLGQYLEEFISRQFYSPAFGYLKLMSVEKENAAFTCMDENLNMKTFLPDGRFSKNGDVMIYPSRDSYERFDSAEDAWQDWYGSVYLKRFRLYVSTLIESTSSNSNNRSAGSTERVLMFATEEAAMKARRKIDELVMSLHEQSVEHPNRIDD